MYTFKTFYIYYVVLVYMTLHQIHWTHYIQELSYIITFVATFTCTGYFISVCLLCVYVTVWGCTVRVTCIYLKMFGVRMHSCQFFLSMSQRKFFKKKFKVQDPLFFVRSFVWVGWVGTWAPNILLDLSIASGSFPSGGIQSGRGFRCFIFGSIFTFLFVPRLNPFDQRARTHTFRAWYVP